MQTTFSSPIFKLVFQLVPVSAFHYGRADFKLQKNSKCCLFIVAHLCQIVDKDVEIVDVKIRKKITKKTDHSRKNLIH